MTETALRELDEAAPAAFVNGDATHRHPPARGSRRAPNAGAGRDARQRRAEPPPAAVGSVASLPATLGPLLRLHSAWRDGCSAVARAQLAFVADSFASLATTGRAIAAEPERRVELAWALALLQLERSLDTSSRMVETMGGIGRELLDAAGPASLRPG
jgi:hypothetical protein